MIRLFSLESKLFAAFTDSVTLTLLSILCAVLTVWWYSREERKNFPPGPYGLPIFGYLPFLGKEPFKTLMALSEKYGKVFSISFGLTPVVIVADNDSLKEAYSKTELLDRPPGLFDFLPGGGGFAGSNGKHWVEQRRFTMKSVRNLGLGKGPWESTMIDEVTDFVKLLKSYKGEAIDLTEDLASSVSRNIGSLLLSKPIERESSACHLINEFVEKSMKFLTEGFFYSNVPGLFDLLVKLNVSGLRKLNEVMHEFNRFLGNEIEERKVASSFYDSGDLIGSYLEEMKKKSDEEAEDSTFDEVTLVANMKGMFLGGSETTRTSLQWLFIAMAMHPDIQEKIYKELETVLVNKEVAQWEDRPKLPWTYSAIMEGQRWKTLSPLNVMRYASADVELCGYHIPKGTAVIGLLWGLHNDERYWKDPEKFDPTRFLKSNGTINWKPESYTPFSVGRRNCPGETVALMEILVYFSAIVRNFQIQAENDKEFHVEGVSGTTYQPAKHKLRFIPRKR